VRVNHGFGWREIMTPREQIEDDIEAHLGLRLRSYYASDMHTHPGIWLSLTFDTLTKAIHAGDTVAISLACDLIECDPMLPFGKIIKSNLARALRKQITMVVAKERAQLVGATMKLLGQQYSPRELEDYCKLIKKFPPSEFWIALTKIEPKNQKSIDLIRYLAESNSDSLL
jgi:hypothetical protein